MKLLIIAFLCFCYFYFYRKPDLIIRENEEDMVYSPAHGHIMDIIYQNDNTILIPIFLSIIDIHYQTFPVSGKITDVVYDATGKFHLAYQKNKSDENEKIIHTMENKNGQFKIYQIAGYCTRKIDYYIKPDTKVESGELLGLIHFGSRVDLIIPKADVFKLNVVKGQYVSGSDTLIGSF